VSILIPAYNAGPWIAETIRSALAQTWARKEIIVVDDGSTDRTLAIARQFSADGVAVVAQANQGASAARNKAFSICHGDYVQWLDADDLLSPDKISSQIAATEHVPSKKHDCNLLVINDLIFANLPKSRRPNRSSFLKNEPPGQEVWANKKILFSSAWAYFYYRTSRARFNPSPLWRDHCPVDWLISKMSTGNHMQTSTWLVSRELTEAAGPWDTRVSLDDDGEYFSRVVAASETIQFVSNGAVFYRVSNPISLSRSGRGDRKLNSLFLSMQLQIQHLLALEQSDRTRQACVSYLNTWLPWFDPERSDIVKRCELIATELGGRLEHPPLPRNYEWIRRRFGLSAAKQMQFFCNRWKHALIQSWDRIHV
jgi:glycosyltransferase involved in cell wall biosynthesis